MFREEVTFFSMGVSGENEGSDASFFIRVEFGKHLIGVADDRCSRAASGPTNASPKVVLCVAIIGGCVSQGGLSLNPNRRRVK